MKALSLHPWQVTPAEAQKIQLELAGRVSAHNELGDVRRVAGADIAIDRENNRARAAVVILSFPEMDLLEVRMVERELTFPYIPGLLSFREVPAILAAFEGVVERPDLLLADGQGLAHPRRFGLACHLGLLLGLPAIGCAKSPLVGHHGPVPEAVGSYAEVVDGDQVVGVALRTKAGCKPIYVSVGHKVDLATAVRLVLQCTRGYRLPEPTRLADRAAAGPVEDREPVAARAQLPML
ncbi:MAG: deoxyribonuclease V [Dehalococcoidia bacterium]|nr:deoxyribonuclease V [Dehalococcoidia bacterium]